MSSFKTKGIIIKRSNYSEADRILTIFTENLGKIRVNAKGVRKIKSRLAGSLELFCLTSFVIIEGRNLDIVTGAVIEKCFFDLRNNYPKTQKAFYLGELTDKLTEENDPHKEIFNLLAAFGYLPEITNCIECRKEILESEKNYFNYDRGGLVCDECKKGETEITSAAIKLLRLFLKHHLSSIKKVKLKPQILKEVEKQTRNYLNQISDKEFKTQRFLK